MRARRLELDERKERPAGQEGDREGLGDVETARPPLRAEKARRHERDERRERAESESEESGGERERCPGAPGRRRLVDLPAAEEKEDRSPGSGCNEEGRQWRATHSLVFLGNWDQGGDILEIGPWGRLG